MIPTSQLLLIVIFKFSLKSEIMDMKEEMMNDAIDDVMGDEDDDEERFFSRMFFFLCRTQIS